MSEERHTPRMSLDSAAAPAPAQSDLLQFLRQALAEGRHAPGERLPTERQLAECFDVTRAYVRRVLLDLEREGLIYRKVGRGTFVSESGKRGPANQDEWRDIGPKELMEARIAVEPAIIQLFIENASPQDEERVQACIERSEASRSFEAFELWDEALHNAIVAGARNPLMIKWYSLITTARKQARWSGIKRRVYTLEYRAQIEYQHRSIVTALFDRNEKQAVEAACEHLKFIHNGLFR